MITVYLVHSFSVHKSDGTPLGAEALHREGERLMEALLDLEAINSDMTDSGTASAADRHEVMAEMTIVAQDESEAVGKSLTLVRTAIHAIGGMTPRWHEPVEPTVNFAPRDLRLEFV